MVVIKFGLIGYGRIGKRLAKLAASEPAWRLTGILMRSTGPPGLPSTTDLEELIATGPQVVFECASRDALALNAPRLLAAGIDVVPLSLTAFICPKVEVTLNAAVEAGPGRIEIPPGGVGSLDVLATAREHGLERVTYRQIKSPAMWKLTPAKDMADVDAIAAGTPFLAGSVREIARHFPDNLNTSVGVALAGLGLDATRVELTSDPATLATSHELDFVAGPGSVSLRVSGQEVGPGGDPADFTAFGLLRLLRRRTARIAI
jgi:aspartate dehydrogenase